MEGASGDDVGAWGGSWVGVRAISVFVGRSRFIGGAR